MEMKKEEMIDEIMRIKKRLDELLEELGVEIDTPKNAKLNEILKRLGIYPNLKGYAYLTTAVEICTKNPDIITEGLVTKRLYPGIAQKFDTTDTRVERAIRHAIEIGMRRGDKELLKEIFGTKEKIKNSEFIATLVEYLH